MDDHPIPPRPSDTAAASGDERPPKAPRMGRLFAPVTTMSNLMVPSKDDGYVWAEVKDRGRTLIRYSRSGENSASSSRSASSSSRSPTPAPIIDDRRRSQLILAGRAPPTPATPILKIRRQHSFVKEKVIVGVRLRPFIIEDQRNIDGELKKSAVSIRSDGEGVTVQVETKSGGLIEFGFDHGFSSYDASGGSCATMDSDQSTVYAKMAQPLVESMISGFNCSFFAYGQTGTGKTFSTLGDRNEPGVVPRFCRELIERMNDGGSGECEMWKLEISYFEIYNENLVDLLSVKSQRQHLKLKVREHPEEGPFIENLISIPVSNFDELHHWLTLGNLSRHQASTTRNDGSSRSHAVFSLKLIQTKTVDGRSVFRKSKANFVDLAGSERLDSKSVSMTNSDRMAETKNINKSLVSLAKVILQLAEGLTFISYRDSILTWLLKDSLGGNAKTVMLATVAPSSAYAEETLSTLRYAANAYKIFNKAYVNEDPAIGLIEQLRMENEALKAATASSTNDRERVATLKAKIEQLEKALREREEEIERQKQEYALKLPEVEKQSRALETEAYVDDEDEEEFKKQMASIRHETRILTDQIKEAELTMRRNYVSNDEILDAMRAAVEEV